MGRRYLSLFWLLSILYPPGVLFAEQLQQIILAPGTDILLTNTKEQKKITAFLDPPLEGIELYVDTEDSVLSVTPELLISDASGKACFLIRGGLETGSTSLSVFGGNVVSNEIRVEVITAQTSLGLTQEAVSLLVSFQKEYDTYMQSDILPYIQANGYLIEMLEHYFPGLYYTENEMSLLGLLGFEFVADYAFQTVTVIDYPSIEQEGGVVLDQLAFTFEDLNRDGWPDMRYCSPLPMGCQILFMLPPRP